MIAIAPDLLMCFMLGIFGKWQCARKLPFLPGIHLYSGKQFQERQAGCLHPEEVNARICKRPGFRIETVSPV